MRLFAKVASPLEQGLCPCPRERPLELGRRSQQAAEDRERLARGSIAVTIRPLVAPSDFKGPAPMKQRAALSGMPHVTQVQARSQPMQARWDFLQTSVHRCVQTCHS